MDMTGIGRAPLKEMKEVGEDLVDRANEVGQRISKSADRAFKESKRAIGRLQDSAEDVLADTRQDIRRRPFESVAIAAAVGAGLGLLIGYMLGSRRR